MDNFATLDEWRGNSHENIRNLFIALVEIFCDSIVLNGDTHDLDEPTPIWDALVAEHGHLPDLSTAAISIKNEILNICSC
ncbi:hypothetical protein CAURIC_03090 [Corynebacterium auriscanis]|uniref:Uncharacterized protein n=1 Tax=Corynebacterium auriscanis TaxID=99807 RepID=A0A0A2DKF3_9CORY|nr:hypothetical protein MA47_09280 [Corynebacterium auriscanis]OFT87609.1 hypothetical protein HMPREF3098_09480 [Corynebacterium sp. HMSC28B08]WJY72282.1 hypothetical protein CAURIC_03090 [Corynebacterium auriscanis]